MNCDWKGCQNEATHFPQIMVPARGVPIDTHQPLSMLIGLHCCLKHCRKFDVKSFLSTVGPDGLNTAMVSMQLLAAGRAAPDFKRAFVIPVSMESSAAKQFESARNVPAQSVPSAG